MGGAWMRKASLVAVAVAIGCATGGEPELTGQAYEGPSPGDDDGATTIATGDDAGTEGEGDEDPTVPPPTADGPALPDLGTCTDDVDCVLPAGTCLEQLGHCDGGVCEHGAADPGTPCDDGDPCTESDACDGEGVCFGVVIECTAPNAQGGACVDGSCMGLECSAGFDDCNSDMADGCETPLGTDSNCGGCGDVCSDGPNATGACMGGACGFQCQGNYENCDGDWANGCEIPTGVPHVCDSTGINEANGCWTAYCGNSADPDATNFGTFYCMDCATCRSRGAGQCQWCNHGSGTFYPVGTCDCGVYEELACS